MPFGAAGGDSVKVAPDEPPAATVPSGWHRPPARPGDADAGVGYRRRAVVGERRGRRGRLPGRVQGAAGEREHRRRRQACPGPGTYPVDHRAVRCDVGRDRPGRLRLRLRHEIGQGVRVRRSEPDRASGRRDRLRAVGLVEQHHGVVAVGQRARQGIPVLAPIDDLALPAKGILVDGDDVTVADDAQLGRRQVCHLRAEQQWRGHLRPEGELALLLRQAQPAVTDLEHVGVVPVPGTALLGQAGCVALGVVAQDALPVVRDVRTEAPQVGQLGKPLEFLPEIAARAAFVGRRRRREHDVAAGGEQRLTRFGVDDLRDLRTALVRELVQWLVAVVQLEVVDPPGRIEVRVLLEVAVTAGGALAGLVAGVLVDAELQTFRVQVVAERA